MRIENALHELRGPDLQERRSQEVKRRQAPKSNDVVELSKTAQSVGSQSVSPSDLNAVSDVRQPRIDAVKQRVAEGFYDRPEVREAIADAVLDSGVVEGVRQEARQVGEARSEIENVPEVREDRVEQALRRLASNFYDSANARVETANRILENIVG
tara:strand:+ start:596 stop:1063 length:468 start_codon:yes stop_codon:yes gene_type:complete